jgi:hypothetical protein
MGRRSAPSPHPQPTVQRQGKLDLLRCRLDRIATRAALDAARATGDISRMAAVNLGQSSLN